MSKLNVTQLIKKYNNTKRSNTLNKKKDDKKTEQTNTFSINKKTLFELVVKDKTHTKKHAKTRTGANKKIFIC